MRFFFYGTLLDGSDNPVARLVHARLSSAGPGQARGTLFAVPDPEGWYPVLLPGDMAVHGRVYVATAAFTPADLARLDAYEDCYPDRPEASLYRREAVTVTGDGDITGPAQAYRFNRPLPPGSRAIPGGDFRSWLAEQGLEQFRGLRDC